jgi:hypothetical protein
LTTFFRAAAIAASTLFPALAHAAIPVAEYNFQNSLASSVAGAPDLVPLVDATDNVPNAFTTAAVDGATRAVLHFPQFNGVALAPTTGLIRSDVYSVAILFSFDEIDGYRRLLDFKNGVTDDGVYSYGGDLNFYPITTGSGTPLVAGAYHQVVLTRDAAGTVTGYVDGAQEISFSDSDGDAVVDENNRLRFFQDNTGGSAPVRESSAGNVARIRVYNVALTPQEVAALDRLPGVPPDRLRLLRIVAGLDAAVPADIAAWDADGDKVLTLADVVYLLRAA